ncbi:MAG: hypothetical protein ACI8TX_002004 [Hyphomicrobiaceae bacterium]|jgi:hypothetical protein
MTHDNAIRLMTKTLRNLDQWMEKAAEYAAERSFNVDVLAEARMAPDQYTFAQQVQATCDQAKYAAAYLSGQEPPSHDDTEKTFAELHARVATCLTFVDGVAEAQFAGAEERKVAPKWLGGAWLTGDDYLVHVALPNFFFHATMVYALLRHNGVALSKIDFIGSMPVQKS